MDDPVTSYYIEIRSIYDGWSIEVMTDGSLRNRWDPNDRRWAQTQAVIEKLKSDPDFADRKFYPAFPSKQEEKD